MKEKAEKLNRELKELGQKIKTAGMFEKPAIAEQMLQKQTELNSILIGGAYGGNES